MRKSLQFFWSRRFIVSSFASESSAKVKSLNSALKRNGSFFCGRALVFLCIILSLFVPEFSWGQINMTSTGVSFSQNFNGMGSSATAALPSGFKIGTNWASGTTATTQAAGTSGAGILTSGSLGGTYNFADGETATASDRALGFLTSALFTSPQSIVLKIDNNTGITVTRLDISFEYEKYRSGSRAFDWTFFHGSTPTPATAAAAGNQSYAADANNTVVFSPVSTIRKFVSLTGLSIANGASYYLRWTFTGVGGSDNGQAIGIDNFSVVAHRPFTYNVNSTADNLTSDNFLTLREAIVLTNFGGNPAPAGSLGRALTAGEQAQISAAVTNDVINLPAGTYNLSIAGTGEGLSPALPKIGDLDIIVGKVAIQGAGMNSTIINQTTNIDRILDVNVNFHPNFDFTMSNLTISGGRESTGNGGGGIFVGSSNNRGLVTITNCKFLDNQSFGSLLASGLGGGAIQHQGGDLTITGCIFDQNTALKSGGAISAFGFRDLPITQPIVVNAISITNSTFTNNQCSGASGGGAIDVFGLNLSAPDVTITGCTFSSNVSTASIGGAISNESSNSFIAEKCTFLNNTATGGGGVYVAGGGGSTIRYCRFVGNTATSGTGGPGVFVSSSTLTADNNWWGKNTTPVGNDARSGGTGVLALTKWLHLKHTASPATVSVGPPTSTTLTASFLTNNLNEGISLPNLAVLIGLPITFDNPVQGTLSNQQTSIQASATATATYTVLATACPPSGFADATVDNAKVTATITVIDNIPPTVSCPSNKTVSNDLDLCGASVILDAIAMDNCPGAFVNYTVNGSPVSSPHFFPVGTTTVVARAEDASGNLSTSTCSFTVTVNDTQRPNISCTSNKTVNTDLDVCTYTHSGTAWDATGTDNCVTISFAYSLSGATSGTGTSLNGKIFNKGITTVLWTATDGHNNTNTCSLTVTVNDNQNPVISCTDNQTVNTGNAVCTYTNSGIVWNATGTDNCPGVTFGYSLTGATTGTGTSLNGTAFNKGMTTVKWTATDASNNTATCSFTVTVNDLQAPTISCPSNKTVSNDNGVCNASVTLDAVASDNCPGSFVNYTVEGSPISNPYVFPLGTTTVVAQAQDASGNLSSSTCSFTVTVNDTQVPGITCTSDKTVNADAMLCTYTHSGIAWDATGSDNCTTISFVYELTGVTSGTGTSLSGVVFNKGITTVKWTATDGNDNTSTCSFSVTVNDNQNPTISCTTDKTVNTDAGVCNYTHSGTAWNATGSDNCTTISFAYLLSGATGGTGTTLDNVVFNKGITTVKWTATDGSSNTATCSFTVTVNDNESPTIQCPTNITTIEDPVGSGSKVIPEASLGTPVTSDNCPGETWQRSGVPAGNAYPIGTTTLTYTVTDAAGKTATCQQTVTVDPACQITCPTVSPVNNDPGQCGAVVIYGEATTTGDCGELNYSLPSGSFFPVGMTPVTVSSQSTGQSCQFTVTVIDNTPPTITCPAEQTVSLDEICEVLLPDFRSMATKSDNCTASGSITISQSPAPGTLLSGSGSLMVTFTATDGAGNTSTCSFAVNKVDDTPPMISCPAPQNLLLGAGCSTALPNYTGLVTPALKNDNCTSPPSITVTQSPAAGTTVTGIGTMTVVLTASDEAGNTATCNLTVNKQDNMPPTIQCPATQTLILGPTCSAVLPDYSTLATASDNCTASGSVTIIQLMPAPGSTVYNTGSVTVKLRATDGAGNTATCSFTVTKVDETPPVITCPSPVSVNAPTGQCSAVVSSATIGTATANDNCTASGSIIISHTPYPAGNSFPVGVTNIVWTATDASGNTATCNQTITVNDIQPPTISAVTTTPAALWPPNHKMVNVSVNYTSTDNCGGTAVCGLTVTSNQPVNGTGDGDTSPDWEIINDHTVKLRAERANQSDSRVYTIKVTCTDASGNTSTASATVVVAHNITSPASGASFKVGSTVNFSGVFWDKPGNKHTAQWVIDGTTTVKGTVTAEPSGNKNGKVTGSYKFNSPGIYKLQMNVIDQNKNVSYVKTNDDLEAIVVIYDPNGGYTYGGGWFNSPAGALVSDPSAIGKANYGFSMNYYKNATNPKGETQFEFKIGDFEYNALNFEYLVISNAFSQFKGTGKIIGGQSGIYFIMSVIDGQVDGTGIDKVRMKIYNKNTGEVYYDNQPGASDAAPPVQPVGSNSEVVIGGTNNNLTKVAQQEVIPELTTGLNIRALPNPSRSNFTINVTSSNTKEVIRLQVVDMYGRIIETKNAFADQTIRLGDAYRPGTYIVNLIQGDQRRQLKLVKLPD